MKSRTAIAAAAAALFLAGHAGFAAADSDADGKVKCEGANSCKGHSDCKSASNDCKGKNGCAGKGFSMMSQKDCDAAKAKAAQKKS
ncbi:MAG TPA: hypothetical protein VMR31_15475 [Myxococcota bacterium]|nr:hypothetical protein [Myxococcota bacterium]